MDASMIAPCGMNCTLCYAYLREKNKCDGCRGSVESKMPSCVRCIISHCDARAECESDFCYVCDKYPCKRLKELDKRYRTKYSMSMLENLSAIKTQGMDAFLKQQSERWTCPDCGGVICVHRGYCYTCGPSKGSFEKELPAKLTED